jgi:hypothetical protein
MRDRFQSELPFVREVLDLDREQVPRLDQTTSRR